MSLLTATLVQLLNRKSLEEEIIEALTGAETPMTCGQIMERVVSQPDRETLSREVYRLVTQGTVEKAGEVTAPPGSFRKTLFTYRLRPRPAEAAAGSEQGDGTATKGIVPVEILGLFSERPGTALTNEEIADDIGRSKPGVYSALQYLIDMGKLKSRKDGRYLRYFVPGQPTTCNQ